MADEQRVTVGGALRRAALVKAVGGGDNFLNLASSANTQNETQGVTSAATVTQVVAENTTANDCYVILYDTAGVPEVGVTTVKRRFKMKANTISAYDGFWTFATGVGYAIVDDDGTTAVAAGQIVDLYIDYQQ